MRVPREAIPEKKLAPARLAATFFPPPGGGIFIIIIMIIIITNGRATLNPAKIESFPPTFAWEGMPHPVRTVSTRLGQTNLNTHTHTHTHGRLRKSESFRKWRVKILNFTRKHRFPPNICPRTHAAPIWSGAGPPRCAPATHAPKIVIFRDFWCSPYKN